MNYATMCQRIAKVNQDICECCYSDNCESCTKLIDPENAYSVYCDDEFDRARDERGE
jgi:hypothetical protein